MDLVGLPDLHFRVFSAFVKRDGLLLLVRGVVLHDVVALLLLEDVATGLHLFRLRIFGAEEIVFALRQIAAVLFDVHCITLLVVALRYGVVLPFRSTAHYLARSALIESFDGGVLDEIGLLVGFGEALGQFLLLCALVLFHYLVDEATVFLETQLDVVTDLQLDLALALQHLLLVVEFAQVGVLGYLQHRWPFVRIKT